MTEGTPPISTPMDRTVLNGHVEELGAETVREVVAKFLEGADNTAALISEALDSGDLKVLAAQSHKLSSGALTLGLTALAELSRTTEHRAKAGDGDVAIAIGRSIAPALDEAIGHLRRYLAEIGG